MSYFVLIVTNKLVFKSVLAKCWGLPRIVRSRPYSSLTIRFWLSNDYSLSTAIAIKYTRNNPVNTYSNGCTSLALPRTSLVRT